MRESLSQLGQKCGTDKGVVHSYLPVYEREAPGGSRLDLLEIGILKGASLQMWSRWLDPGSRIVGIDRKLPSLKLPDNIKMLQVDIRDIVKLHQLLGKDKFDWIIDDGSHRLEDQLLAVAYLWPRLRSGGVYWIEDVVEGSLPYFEIFDPLVFRLHKNGRPDDILLRLMKL